MLRITMEKEAELEAMRSKKRGERDFFKKMENGELETKEEWRPKLLVGKLNKDVSLIINLQTNKKRSKDIDTLLRHLYSKSFRF